jgi:hypothetical protein
LSTLVSCVIVIIVWSRVLQKLMVPSYTNSALSMILHSIHVSQSVQMSSQLFPCRLSSKDLHLCGVCNVPYLSLYNMGSIKSCKLKFLVVLFHVNFCSPLFFLRSSATVTLSVRDKASHTQSRQTKSLQSLYFCKADAHAGMNGGMHIKSALDFLTNTILIP